MAIGFILQPTWRVRDAHAVVQLYGRLDEGPAFLVEDDRFRPYFFVPREHAAAIPRADDVVVEETDLRDLEGRPVLRVVAGGPGAVPQLRARIEAAGGCAHEADLRFPYRYLIDHDLRAGVAIEGDADEIRPGLLRFRNPKLSAAPARPVLRTLAIDLETSPDATRIYAASLVGDGADEVHLVAKREVAGAIVHADEVRLLVAVCERIRAIDPDVLTGWNVVDFDLRTFEARCEKLRIRSELGRVPGGVRFQQDPGFTRQSRASIPGRVVLDGIPLVRDAVRLEDYRLETAAREILGRGKLIDAEAPDSAAEIDRLYREDPAALVAYNREDSRLVMDLLAQEGLLDLSVERSLLSGMPLDRVGASIASFDRLYLPELRRSGFVAPSVDHDRERGAGVQGGALLEPQPGVFSDVAVFDFKSLYPSLIRTFNLDPVAYATSAIDAEDAIAAPNGARFSRTGALLPGVIERFMARRDLAKRRGDRHADQAIKIMMNALFGVLGAGSCRFFNPAIANAITGFGQQTLAWTRDGFEANGVTVLYGDTDSVFVQLAPSDTDEARRAQAEALRARVEGWLSDRIRDEYRVEPRLDLELERIFDRLLLPRVRGGTGGSKKRYAGWCDGRLEVVGLEAVRRDWPAIAGRLQRGLLTRIFRDEDALPFAKELVAGLRAGAFDAELVIVKRIRKASLERYTATTPPHVQAARRARERDGVEVGGVVHYVMTREGPEPVFPGRPLPPHIDHAHYLERVLRPVADAILVHTGQSWGEVLEEPRQMSLL